MTSSAARRRRTLPALLAAVVATAALLLPAAPAAAHDELVSSDPAAGATLEAAPEQITLTFSADILAEDGATQVQVTDETGATLSEDAPVVAGTAVTQAVTGEASGVVSVLWRVVSSDGHPISGDFTFTVPTAPAPAPTPAETTAAPSAPTTATPAPAPEATATETAIPISAPVSDASPLPWIVGALALLLVVGALVWLLVSRGRRGPGASGSTGTPAR